MRRWFRHTILSRRWATFVVMGLSFLAFGGATLNLFFVLKANLGFIGEHGWDAAREGGIAQLLELLLTAYAGMAAYVVFKACEHSLVHELCDPPTR